MKVFYYDVETTGVKHWRNGIHQISGIVEIDGVIKETFDFKVQPHPKCTIEKEALDVGRVTEEQVLGYPEMKGVHGKLDALLSKYVDRYDNKDKFFLAGYNSAHFDDNFFRAFFTQNGDKYFGSWFWAGSLDVIVLASEYLKYKRHLMLDFKLMTVAKEVGLNIDESKLHDAVYDVMLTREIYRLIAGKPAVDELG